MEIIIILNQTIYVIADTALELIPKELIHLDTIKKSARKKDKKPYSMLLDASYHHKEMESLENSKKRGRPDILHICLLSLLGLPEIKKKPTSYRILIHTYNKEIFEINPEIRLPRHYFRFIGLMEQLLLKGKISSKNQILIQKLDNTTLEKQLKSIKPENRLLFTSKGKEEELRKLFDKRINDDLALIFGGFPHGSFSTEIENLTDEKISISNITLDAWIALSRIAHYKEFISKSQLIELV